MKALMAALRQVVDRLGFRLALVLAVALLPLMIVSIARSQGVVNEALARSQAALVGETLRAVHREVIIIERANAIAQTLSRSMKYLLNDLEQCSRLMKDGLADTPFSFAGYYDVTGNVPCSSADAPFSFGMTPNLEKQLADPRPMVLVNDAAPVSGTSVIFASHPVFAPDGSVAGFTSVSVPHHQLKGALKGQSNANFITFTRSGTILTAPGTLEEAQAMMPMLSSKRELTSLPLSFQGTGRDGVERLYSVVPLVDQELFALATWAATDELSGGFYLADPTLFPLLMWVASLAVSWFAVSLLVTRHVVRLRQAMAAFAKHRKMPDMRDFKDAPGDLREAAAAYQEMTDTILRDEARIEDSMRQKDVLLREVHHRVKNNLQLITSIMSMQMRQSRSPELLLLLRGLHDRVNSLATIHRSLYQTTGQADIQMDEHLKTIVSQVVRVGAEKANSISVTTNFVPLRLNPDQAVPLSLFVTEAMTNALKYIGPDDQGEAWLTLTLEQVGEDKAHVQITNSLGPDAPPPDPEKSSGLGSELMEAFSDQLGGEMLRQQTPGKFTVDLTFEVEALIAKN